MNMEHSYYALCFVYMSGVGALYLPDSGRNKTLRTVQTYDVVLTSCVNSNRSRFLQAYTLNFLHCNKPFVHTFFNMACLKPRELAAVKGYP